MGANKSTCKNHEKNVSTHYCLEDQQAVCKSCADGGCFDQGHTLANLEVFYSKQIEELDSLASNITRLRGGKDIITPFQDLEVKRVNEEFDAQISQIEEKRAQTLEGISRKINKYVLSHNASGLQSANKLQQSVDQAKNLGIENLAEMVRAIGQIQDKIREVEANSSTVTTQKQLSRDLNPNNTFFDSSKLVDMRNVSLIHSELKEVQKGNWVVLTDVEKAYKKLEQTEQKVRELEKQLGNSQKTKTKVEVKPKPKPRYLATNKIPPWEQMGKDKDEWIERYEMMNDNDPTDWDDPKNW
mmetsp:Transcript_52236/g.59693  ORF Transcript_52236/g.59693 Transcript_52236/m.59693 type:complete len:299 (-) Transcript_52236:258-1154(-)